MKFLELAKNLENPQNVEKLQKISQLIRGHLKPLGPDLHRRLHASATELFRFLTMVVYSSDKTPNKIHYQKMYPYTASPRLFLLPTALFSLGALITVL